jgi:hypothetical protein
MALAIPAFADEIPYGVRATGDIPFNVTTADNIPNGVTTNDEIPYGGGLLNLLLILL